MEEPETGTQAPPEHKLVEAVGAVLAARWLPAKPWEPEEEWREIEFPEVEMPPAAVSVLTSLFTALQTIRVTLNIDIADPTQGDSLARVIATLNERLPELQEMEEDRRPWLSLLQLNHQAGLVEQAARSPLFQEEEPAEPVLPAWRPVLRKVMALAPFVAMGQQLKLDWAEPDVTDRLQAVLRVLATIRLQPLRDPALVLRLVARLDAVARLQDSLGADPRPHSFHRVRAAVERRAERAAALLPEQVQLRDGVLVGLPPWEPNLGAILNPATIAQARRITPETLARMKWKVPAFEQLSVLTVGLPAAHLVGAMARLGENPVRQSPCDRGCDAARVMRTQAASPGGAKAASSGGAKAPTGSGTGAGPAG